MMVGFIFIDLTSVIRTGDYDLHENIMFHLNLITYLN